MAFFQKQLGRIRWKTFTQGSLMERGILVKHIRQFTDECGLWLTEDFPPRNGSREGELWGSLALAHCPLVLGWMAIKVGENLSLPDALDQESLQVLGLGEHKSREFWSTSDLGNLQEPRALVPRKDPGKTHPIPLQISKTPWEGIDGQVPEDDLIRLKQRYLSGIGLGRKFFSLLEDTYNRLGKRKQALRARICGELSAYDGTNLSHVLDRIQSGF